MTTEIETKDGTIYVLPSGKRVLITHAQMYQIGLRVGWGITWRMVLAICASFFLISSGCRLGTPDFEPPWNGSTNSVNRPWKAGLALTFVNPPSVETKELLAAAGAVAEPVNVFVILRYDRFNEAQNAALEAAMREGAVVTGR